MKKILIILSVVSSLSAFAQDQNKDIETTKSEKFSQRSGTLLQKDFIDLGNIAGTEVKLLKIKDLNNNESNSSVRFEKEGSGTYSDTYISAIDKDEVDGLIISIKNLIDNVLKTTPTTYTEVTYSSRGGFCLGSYFEERKSKWTSFLKVEKHSNKSMGILSESDLQNLLILLEQAKTKM
ncbi:hypothetical protein EG349_05695 [Chryseobacterium shandongense]|uniref:Uncharacterized protein n=1 Tax=Chryseobacterium shandongense TaxID=1493872 RepID=A0AAD1DL09_9FLAO|nr:hypothetical protein [Chryseobacterium shandongense]AZA86316.1 hypothetical protein EG349_05695 [Chryseobacterium shandongense]AZA94727.1 hypothetical protein EG353_03715 [Chryseobacterium shandongense]